jgi:hypothetical protein
MMAEKDTDRRSVSTCPIRILWYLFVFELRIKSLVERTACSSSCGYGVMLLDIADERTYLTADYFECRTVRCTKLSSDPYPGLQ